MMSDEFEIMKSKDDGPVQHSSFAIHPSKRRAYPRYKPSGIEWLGEIPEHWEVKRIRHVIQCLDSNRIPLSAQERGDMQGDYPYWGANGIVDYLNDWLFDEPLVLLGEDGAPFFAAFKEIAFYTTGKVWVNNHIHVLRPFAKLLPIYLTHVLNISDYSSFIEGSTRDKLTQDKMKNIPIVFPSLEEQRDIVAFLDRETTRIDGLIEKKQRQIELLQEKHSTLISHSVTKGLDPNAKMKDSGIEWLREIPEHWEVKRLRYLVSEPLKYGANESAELDDPDLPRYIRITDIDENGRLRDETFKSLPEDTAHPYLLMEGDLLLARSGATVGKSFFYEPSWGRAAYAGYLIRARFNPAQTMPRFVNYFTNSKQYWQWLSSSFIQATIQNVSAEKFANLIVPTPPIDGQVEIIAYLDRETTKIDTLIKKVEGSIDLLREYRTALISAAVTGKIDVRDVVFQKMRNMQHKTL